MFIEACAQLKKMSLQSSIYWQINPQRGWGHIHSSSSPHRMLTDPVSWRSCTDSHICCAYNYYVMSVGQHPTLLLLLHFFCPLHSFYIFLLDFSLSLGWMLQMPYLWLALSSYLTLCTLTICSSLRLWLAIAKRSFSHQH